MAGAKHTTTDNLQDNLVNEQAAKIVELEGLLNAGIEVSQIAQNHLDEITAAKNLLEIENAELVTKLAEAEASVGKLLEQLGNVVNAAPNSLAIGPKKAVATPTETVEVDGKQYKFSVPRFRINGREYLSAEAALQPDVLSMVLSKNGQTVLSEVL
jgi:hypothetical protein